MKQTITLFAIIITIQVTAQVKFGATVNYSLGTKTQKTNASPLLFLSNAVSAGVELSKVPKNSKSHYRFKFNAEYISGNNDEAGILAYAKKNDIVYTSYKFSKANINGLSLMPSLQVLLFPKSEKSKMPFIWLEFKGGVLLSNVQKLEFFNQQSTPNKTLMNNSISYVYAPQIVVNLFKTKKMLVNLKGGYSNWGGLTFGLNLSQMDCYGGPCCKCPVLCNPCVSASNNQTEN